MSTPAHRRSFAKGLRRVALGTAGIVVVLLMLRAFGNKMLYPAPAWPVPSPPPSPLEEVLLPLGGGGDATVVAWAWEAPGGSEAPAVVFFHGNGENLGTMHRSGLYEELMALGVHFLAVEYPGYGRGGGRPSEGSLVAAGRAGWRWLRDRHPESPHVVLGWSLGAAVAIQVAAAAESSGETVDRLVLLSAWDDLPSLASHHFPSWLARLALADRYDSRAVAGEIRAPTLLVHGIRDRIIPIIHGERLDTAFADGVSRFVGIENAGHNDLLGVRDVWRVLGGFLFEPRGVGENRRGR